jgi:hypothetical protein
VVESNSWLLLLFQVVTHVFSTAAVFRVASHRLFEDIHHPEADQGLGSNHIAQVEPERLLAALAASSQELALELDSGTQDEHEHDGHYGSKSRPRGAERDGLTWMGLGCVLVNDAGYAEQAQKGQEGAGKTTDPNQSGADRIESCRRDRKEPTGEVSDR